jgi:hypothetical protein
MEDEAFGKAVDRIGDILETNLGSKGDGHG